ncbi:MAG: TonB-dependent receptor [Tenacibaculum sp.]|nr:TonB-dependent receptor [Tenacibaculum sp.]
MVLNKNIFVIYFLFLIIHTSFSQKKRNVEVDSIKIEKLNEVMVTATRTIRQLSSLPLPVQIVSKKEIKNINSLRLSDLLSEQTGLTIVQDHGKGIQMQGMDASYTLILIDGVPLVGRTAGTLDLSRITVGNIKQIEIVKGASSSLYGSEALAGVINIITEKPSEGFKGEINSRTDVVRGSNINSNVSANLNYKKEKFGFSLFANRYGSGGYDLDKSTKIKTVDPYHNYTFNTKFSYNFSKDLLLYLSGRYYKENQKNITDNFKGENNKDEWNTHLKLDYKYNKKWAYYADLYATHYKINSYLNNLDGSRYSEYYYKHLLVRPEMRITYNPIKNHSFIGGLGWTHETLNKSTFENTPQFNSPYVYLQYDTNITEKLNVVLGGRFDKHSEYKSQFSPKGAIRYAFNDIIALKGSVGYGYKAPSFNQLYLDWTNPTVGYSAIGHNLLKKRMEDFKKEGQIAGIITPLSEFEKDLRPESSLSFNVGIQLKPISSLSIDVNVFRNNIKDLIETRAIARKTNGQNVFSYKNVNKVYTEGLEVNTTWKPIEQLKISAGYQLLFAKAKDIEGQFEQGKVYARKKGTYLDFKLKKQDYFGLFNRSRHMANAKIFYNIPKLNLDANIRATYRSKYGLYDTNNNSYLDVYDEFINGYAIIDFAINKTIYKNYKIGFGVDNLLNFTDNQNISGISGRLIYGTVNINF